MVRHRLRLYSYHTFLVIPFIVLFLYAHNPGQTTPDMTYRTLGLGMALTVVFFGIFYAVLKDRLKTGVMTTVVLFALFQYGVIYELFERMYYAGSWPFSNIHRYLILLYILVLGGFFWFIAKSPKGFVRINYFLNVLVCILLVFNIFKLGAGSDKKSEKKSGSPGNRPGLVFRSAAGKPNIYYLVLDGYAARSTLEKYYGFDNAEFLGALRKLGFRVSENAFSNYYYTSGSLCATLNMDFNEKGENLNAGLQDNRLFEAFRENGYRVYYLYSGYAVTSSFRNADSTVYIDGPNEFEKSLLKHTILRLDDLIGLFARQRLSSQFSKMHDLAAVSHRPRFTFMHFVAPHPPYIFKRDGSIRTRHRFAEHSWEPKEFYVDQLVYLNGQIETLVTGIRQRDPEAVIILQSDHGPWITGATGDDVFEARSKILYAWYAPQLHIPDTTSSVNTFRYVLNSYFNTGFSILPDSMAGKAALMKDPLLLKKVGGAQKEE
jgi:hypothetical protein